MTLKSVLNRDYFLLPILSIIYFLTIKGAMPSVVYVIIALLTSIYFFPVKLFLENDATKFTSQRRIVVLLSYFIISNLIAISILLAYQTDLGFIRTVISIYSLINLAFLIYFHMTESGGYNFILTCCTFFLTFALIVV